MSSSNEIAGSRVCVVGGAGFLGSHLCRYLESQDCFVRVIDNLSVGQLKFMPDNVDFYQLDISNSTVSPKLSYAFEGIDYVFNYAAMPFIPDAFDNPIDFVNTNVVGALRVCGEAARAGVKRILQVSSAEVYGNSGQNCPLDEHAALSPPSTYATTKVSIDALCVARFKERGIPVIILRQFNCIGERETHPYVVPEIINQVFNAMYESHSMTEVQIRLGENTERDFLYAGDAVVMASELLLSGQLGEVYNMGSQNKVLIYELARIICGIIAKDIPLKIQFDKSRLRPAEIYSLCSDNSKLYDTIKYRPETGLEEALEKTISYFRNNAYSWDFTL